MNKGFDKSQPTGRGEPGKMSSGPRIRKADIGSVGAKCWCPRFSQPSSPFRIPPCAKKLDSSLSDYFCFFFFVVRTLSQVKWTPLEVAPQLPFHLFFSGKKNNPGTLPFHRRNKPTYSLQARPWAHRAIFARANFPFEGGGWGGWCISQIPILLLLPMAPCRDFFYQPTNGDGSRRSVFSNRKGVLSDPTLCGTLPNITS